MCESANIFTIHIYHQSKQCAFNEELSIFYFLVWYAQSTNLFVLILFLDIFRDYSISIQSKYYLILASRNYRLEWNGEYSDNDSEKCMLRKYRSCCL